MEIEVRRLREALELLEPAVPSKPTLPVLENVRLGGGRVVATDLEVAVLVGLPEAEEDLLLPYRKAREFLKAIPGLLGAHITQEGKQVLITGGQASASYEAPPAEDYPPIPTIEPQHEAAVDGDGLLRALTSVLPCVAKSDTRPVLTTVCLTLGETPEVAGADSFRLAWAKAPRLPGEGQLLIPAKAVVVLAHLWRHAPKPPELPREGPAQLARAKRLVRLEYSQDKLRVSFGEVAMLAQLVQGTFPNYRQLIPSGEGTTVTFMAEDLLRVVQGMEKLAKQGSGIIRLRWSGESLQVEVKAEESRQVAEVAARTHGEGNIAFNIRYLTDYLTARTGPITLNAPRPDAPGLFAHRGIPDLVLMPMFVQWGTGAPGGEIAPPAPQAPVETAPESPPAPAPKRKRGRKS